MTLRELIQELEDIEGRYGSDPVVFFDDGLKLLELTEVETETHESEPTKVVLA